MAETMKENISNEIERLSLHDSYLEKIERIDKSLIYTFDWGKLENYREKDIDEGIIIGKCILEFERFADESLIIDFSGSVGFENKSAKEIDFSPELFTDWLVLENKLEDKNRYCLSGLIDYQNISGWLSWQFSFKDFKLTWNDYISWEDWKNGKPIEDK
jgi:hypothetical protein